MRRIIRIIKLGKAGRKAGSVPFDRSANVLGNVYKSLSAIVTYKVKGKPS